MTNAELLAKIKTEIERQIKNYRDDGFGCHANSLENLLSFLDTLESEAKEEKKVPTRIYLGSKYEFIRKDIILKEIEGLKKNNEVSDDKEYASYELDVACGYDMACDDILSFLKPFAEVDKHPKNILAPSKECEPGLREPLESEKPMQEDLEKELDKWRHEHFHGKRDNHFSGEYLERTSQLDLARHFAKWGAEHAKND